MQTGERICAECGRHVWSDDRYCPSCGTAFTGSPPRYEPGRQLPGFRRPVAPPAREASDGAWTEEPREGALARSPEFGRRFFAELFRRFPDAAAVTTFQRWSVQPDDVYAAVNLPGMSFTVQIDPDLEYVIVSAGDASAEFGDWAGDQVRPALEYVTELAGGERP